MISRGVSTSIKPTPEKTFLSWMFTAMMMFICSKPERQQSVTACRIDWNKLCTFTFNATHSRQLFWHDWISRVFTVSVIRWLECWLKRSRLWYGERFDCSTKRVLQSNTIVATTSTDKIDVFIATARRERLGVVYSFLKPLRFVCVKSNLFLFIFSIFLIVLLSLLWIKLDSLPSVYLHWAREDRKDTVGIKFIKL